MKIIVNYLFLASLLLPTMLSAQAARPFSLHAKYVDGVGVRLKFIPLQWENFRQGLKEGFVVERMELDSAGQGTYRQLTSQPVRPYSEAQWAQVKDGQRHYEVQQQMLDKVLNPPERPASGLQVFIDAQARGEEKLMGFYLLRFTRSPEAAEGSGLQFTDVTAEAGKSYLYRIRIAGTDTVGTVHLFTDPDSWFSPTLEASPGDRMVSLTWEHDGEDSPFLGYYVEKSADGKSFSPVTEDLIFYNKALEEVQDSFFQINQIRFTDSLAQNGVPWYYRIVAKDLFGELATPSNVVEVIGVDQTPPAPPFNVQFAVDDEQRTISLTWEKKETEPDLAGFVVMGASSELEEFKALHEAPLPPDARSFTVKNPGEGQRLFFTILAYDHNGNRSGSMPKVAAFKDLTPPAPPTGLSADLDEAGHLRLTWQPNTEPDLAGYRVFSSLLPEGGFANATSTPLEEPLYLDTLSFNRLVEDYYFRVVAFDQKENYSEPSETVKVSIPDTIPPVAPLLKDAVVQEGKVHITWIASSSLDIAEHQLQRRNLPEGKWQPVFSSNSTEIQEFTDPKVEPGKSYEYRLLAIDDAGLSTYSLKTRQVSLPIAQNLPLIAGMEAKWVGDKVIELRWKLPYGFDGNVLLYRSVDGGKPVLYKTLKAQGFQDTKVSPGKTYRYYAVAQYSGGRLSERSVEVTVNSRQ